VHNTIGNTTVIRFNAVTINNSSTLPTRMIPNRLDIMERPVMVTSGAPRMMVTTTNAEKVTTNANPGGTNE